MSIRLRLAVLFSLMVVILVFVPPVLAGPITKSGFVTRGGAAIGTWNIKAKSVSATSISSSGAFLHIEAMSFDDAASPTTDQHILPPRLPYVLNTPYSTRQTIRTGTKFEAQSKVVAKATKITPTGTPAGTNVIEWTATPGNFGINVLAPTGTTGERADALWVVRDPVDFSGLSSGDEIEMTYAIGDEWDFFITPLGPELFGTFSHFGSASSSVVGLENLFSWTIQADSSSLGNVFVDFNSNPLLGLDDTLVTNDILSRFSFNPTSGLYDFNDVGFQLSASFMVPSGVSTVSIETEAGSSLSAQVVPEPSTIILFSIGVLGIIGMGHRQRKKVA